MPTETSRILVVEDEESLADSVRYNLEREGFAVAVATDGRRALERFRTDPPSLVIRDLMLPEVSVAYAISAIPIGAVLFVVGQLLVFPEVLHAARAEKGHSGEST